MELFEHHVESGILLAFDFDFSPEYGFRLGLQTEFDHCIDLIIVQLVLNNKKSTKASKHLPTHHSVPHINMFILAHAKYCVVVGYHKGTYRGLWALQRVNASTCFIVPEFQCTIVAGA